METNTMTNKQKLELRISEVRSRLNEISGLEGDAFTPEVRAEAGTLQGEYGDLEVRHRAAIVSEDDAEKRARLEYGDDPEARERRELRAKVSMGAYIGAAQEQRGLEGAEAEYNQACGVRSGRFPLHLLEQPEVRAETDASAKANQQTWIDRVFEQSMANALGITMKSVPAGVATFPVTTSGATGGQRARMEAKSADTWAVSAIELKPKRNTAHLIFSLEDSYRLPGLEEAIRRDMRMAVMEAVDRAIFTSDAGADGTDADITGLQTHGSVSESTLTQANKVRASQTFKVFVDLIDGKYAAGLSDLNIVASVGANALWESTTLSVASETASIFKTLASFLRENGIKWMTRGGIDTATTNGKFGAFIGLNRGIENAGVVAMWDEGMLIRDEFTSAAKGEVNLTLCTFWDFALPRAGNYKRLKFTS